MNINPDTPVIDDDEFPRLTGNSIGEGDAAYGDKGDSWIKMHDVTKKFHIFGDTIEAKDIH